MRFLCFDVFESLGPINLRTRIMTKQAKQLQVAVSGYDAVTYFNGQAVAGDLV